MPYDGSSNEELIADLRKGREYAATHRHIKGRFTAGPAGCCTAFAATTALHYRPYVGDFYSVPESPALSALAATIASDHAGIGSAVGLVCGWNNGPDITQEDVVALFDRTIARLGG